MSSAVADAADSHALRRQYPAGRAGPGIGRRRERARGGESLLRLDFKSVAEIRSRIMQARNRGAAVFLVSEDLDEILELADRVLVISDGKIVYETPIAEADRQTIGRHMAGH